MFEFLWIENKEKERLLAFNAAVCAFNVFTYKVKKNRAYAARIKLLPHLRIRVSEFRAEQDSISRGEGGLKNNVNVFRF